LADDRATDPATDWADDWADDIERSAILDQSGQQ
jgi:hypothetical protein